MHSMTDTISSRRFISNISVIISSQRLSDVVLHFHLVHTGQKFLASCLNLQDNVDCVLRWVLHRLLGSFANYKFVLDLLD